MMQLEGFVENINSFQEIVALVVTVAGIIVACAKVIATMYTTAMASPIEVALMKKSEQYKYKVSNLVLVWFVFLVIFIYVGALFLFSNLAQNSLKPETEVDQVGTIVEVEEELEIDSTLDSGDSTDGKSVEQEIEVQTQSVKANGNESDNINALIFVLGFFGTVCLGIVLIIIYSIKNVIKIVKWYKHLDIVKKKKIMCAFGGSIIFFGVSIWIAMRNPWIFLWILLIVLSIGLFLGWRRWGVETFIEGLKLAIYIFIFILELGINNVFIWRTENYTSFSSLLGMSFASAILAFLICFYLFIAIKLNINPGQAKVMYFNKNMNKDLYLYFKYNDEFFVAGEKEILEKCEAYYLVKVDEIIGKRLERVSIDSSNYSKIYGENIILQLDGEQDIILDDVMEKLLVMLQNSEVSRSEYGKTKVYIKPKEKMVYFYLPNEKIDRSEQNFSL